MGELDAAFGSRPSGKEATLGSIDIPVQGSNPALKDKINSCAPNCSDNLNARSNGMQKLTPAEEEARRRDFGMDTSDGGQSTRTPGGRAEALHAKADSVGGKGFVPPTETGSNSTGKGVEGSKVETPKGFDDIKNQYLQRLSQTPDGSKKWLLIADIEKQVALRLNKNNPIIPPHIVSQVKSIVNSRDTGASNSSKN